MQPPSPPPLLESAASAQDILSTRFGGPVLLGNGSSFQASGRSTLFRFDVVDGPSAAPRSIVVKRASTRDQERFDPLSAQEGAVGLFNEWAGLQLLSKPSGDQLHVPQWYGGDRSLGLVVMEDLGQCTRLDHLLLGNDAVAAETALVRMASVLGTLHGQCSSRRDEYDQLRDGLGPKAEPQRPEEICDSFKPVLQRLAEHFGIVVNHDALSDVDALAALFLQDHPYWTYTHGDPCPDNWLFPEQGMTLIDFESGAFGNALLDGVYGRMHFPTCWCTRRIPEQVIVRMEHAYRHELSKRVAAALDEVLYTRTLVEACAVHTLKSLRRYLPGKDLLWGVATLQQRAVLRTALFFELTEKHGHLKSLGHLCMTLGASISAVNEGRSAQMPFYPAFRVHSVGS